MSPAALFAACTPFGWEAAAIFAAIGAAIAVRWARPLPRFARAFALARFDHPWGWDGVFVALGLILNLPAVFAAWARVSPLGSPMGPDSDVTWLSAVALETGQRSLYSMDRYPAFPWASSALAHGASELAAAGLHLSMGATVLSGLAAYALARQLGGRVAGFFALSLVLRLPGVVDAGRQFTPYAGIAALDLVGVAALVALAKRHALAALPLAFAAAGVFAADPKQLPVALAFVALGAAFALLTFRAAGLAMAGVLLAALPTVNFAMARLALPVGSVEAITARVPLGFEVDASLPLEGWSPGDPFPELFATLERVARAVHVPAGREWVEPTAWLGVRMELPSTSAFWLLLVLTLPLVRLVTERSWRELLVPLTLLPLAPVGLAVLHLHFQHRYFLALAVLLPPLVAAAASRLLGPAGCAALALAVLAGPFSPWRAEAPGLTAPGSRQTDAWAGPEAGDWSATVSDLQDALPADAFVLDYAASRPWVMLAALRPYQRCVWLSDSCRGHLHDAGSLYAVLFARERPSYQEAPGAESLATVDGAPATVGDCWARVAARPGNGGLYRWTCDVRPRTWVPPPLPPEAPR